MTKRALFAAIYIAANLIAIRYSIAFGPHLGDWQLWASLPDKLANGLVYAPAEGAPFVWSPVAAWLMAGVSLIGYWPWVVAHFLVLPMLGNAGLIVLTLGSWAFWWDAASAHTMTFILVSAVLAVRGSRAGALVYLALLLLMPRPLQLPLAAWLLWRRPDIRWPFVAIFAVHAAIVLASGMAVPWVEAMVGYGATAGLGIGPGRYLGTLWLIAGIPIALILMWRGWHGWAGVAVSPYLLPQYLLMPLVDLVPKRRSSGSRVVAEHGADDVGHGVSEGMPRAPAE